MRWVVVLLAVLLFAIPVTGQNMNAAPISFKNAALFLHGDESTETEGWMNTDRTDPDATDVAWGTTESCAPVAPVPVVNEDPQKDRTVTVTLTPSLRGAVALEGNVEMNLYVGSSSASNEVDVFWFLDQGSTRIAEGPLQTVAFTPANESPDGKYKLVTWSVPAQASIAAADDLVLTLRMTTEEGNCDAAFFGVSEERGKSHFILPVKAPENPPNVHGEDLDGEAHSVVVPAANGTSDSFMYNWTATAGNVTFAYNVTLEAGSIELTLTDGSESNFHTVSITATDRGSEDLTWSAGAWSLRIDFVEFTGSLDWQISETGQAPPLPSTSTSTSPTTTPGTTSTTTGGNNGMTTPPTGEDTPAGGPAALIVALGGLALVARRRT